MKGKIITGTLVGLGLLIGFNSYATVQEKLQETNQLELNNNPWLTGEYTEINKLEDTKDAISVEIRSYEMLLQHRTTANVSFEKFLIQGVKKKTGIRAQHFLKATLSNGQDIREDYTGKLKISYVRRLANDILKSQEQGNESEQDTLDLTRQLVEYLNAEELEI